MTSIRMFPAGNGDAFLVTHKGREHTALLIDGGYATTFDTFILPELKALATSGVLLDIVVITHIDADHISGVLKFVKNNGAADCPQIIPVKRIWHNSLRSLSLPAQDLTEMTEGDRELLTEVRDRGYASPNTRLESQISARQGSSLASLLRSRSLNWNEGDGSQPIVTPFSFQLNSEVKATVLGPTEGRLAGLRDWWIREIRRTGVVGAITIDELLEDAFEFVCSYEAVAGRSFVEEISASRTIDKQLADVYAPDDSVTNGSSISMIIETPEHRLLFLADSWAEDIETALQETQEGQAPWMFDAIKLSHHGSCRNTSPLILQMVDSPRFFVSTNGEKHAHPDVEVLKAIVDRPSTFRRELFCNFSTPASQYMKKYQSTSGSEFCVHENFRKPVVV